MRAADQGTERYARYTVVPRTLTFLTLGEQVLLLRGAANKRLWAGRLNGVGGHVEPGEDPHAGACREVQEETGLLVDNLCLRALIHVSAGDSAPGVLLFVFVGRAPTRVVRAHREGELVWCSLNMLPWSEMVDDLPLLLPRLFAPANVPPLIYGLYWTDEAGKMHYQYVEQRDCAII